MTETNLVGTPSDEVAPITATGRSGVGAIFVSMTRRHPEGRDADYLEWHTLDHRPEQYRLAELRSTFRLISTPACRAARATPPGGAFDDIDHVMSYFFAGEAGFPGFVELSDALRDVGRTPYLLPLVERGVFRPAGQRAAPRVRIGADVLPWYPARGVYLLLEDGDFGAADDLADVPGVSGVWWADGIQVGPMDGTVDTTGRRIVYCWLDAEPPEVGERIRPVLEKRWAGGTGTPLLAAPFHAVVPWEWDRYLP